jgi:hypothetical protein
MSNQVSFLVDSVLLADKISAANVQKVVSMNPLLGDCASVYNDWKDSHRSTVVAKSVSLAEKISVANVAKVISKNSLLGDCPSVYNDWKDSHRSSQS